MREAWAAVCAELQKEVSVDTFNRWFRDTALVELSQSELTLRVPNNIYQLWIESNYLGLLRSATMLVFGTPCSVRFTFAPEDAAAAPPPPPEPKVEPVPVEPKAEPSAAGHGLNARNTFELFVVGTNNQYAHAACSAVANAPGKTYNPLFIYGGVGLGKTHLMQAIGQHILKSRKNSKVCYVTSERFTNEFIDAIQNSTLVNFRKRNRQADLLQIDDIQFLAGKERSQEEFFHTFNALFDGHKQIVLSSDRPPSEIANLEHRLVSRFEWGLTAELQPPDIETRLAILRKKAEGLEVRLEPSILEFLAERIRTNVRRLEGGLMRVASFASLSGSQPTTEKIEHLLKDILQEEARRAITIDQIQRRVAEHFDVRLADMTSKRRPQNIAFPRQIAMYLSRELTRASLAEIGDAFGGRDHGTVLHAHRLVKGRMGSEEKVRQVVAYLDSQLQR
ncbi:MAG: chromosomal replication initiator protein DnaA [Verrucomicrobiota bacterium]